VFGRHENMESVVLRMVAITILRIMMLARSERPPAFPVKLIDFQMSSVVRHSRSQKDRGDRLLCAKQFHFGTVHSAACRRLRWIERSEGIETVRCTASTMRRSVLRDQKQTPRSPLLPL
jgi:hypothetical protein